MSSMQGRRVYSDHQGGFFSDPGLTLALGTWSSLQGGDYWKWAYGWAALCPGGIVANLARHKVDEHEDGTITVSPSILCRGGSWQNGGGVEKYHGFLERGVWRSC